MQVQLLRQTPEDVKRNEGLLKDNVTESFEWVFNEAFCCVDNHLLVQDLYSMPQCFFFLLKT